ncbi:MAG: RNA polymerase sigma factor [Deltaproteobacteria bacterium]|nr:RNA polymerase sigma factor [Deltaproteobacteria bacterium]
MVVSASSSEVDLRLVKEARRGDARAIEQLYERHSGAVYSMALRMTGRAADAEDVTQDTFLRAWRSFPRFRGKTAVRSWLIGIGINLCRDLHRRKKKTQPLKAIPAPTDNSDGIARRWLDEAVRRLPEGYREVLVMHDVLEMRHPEIAEILGVSVGTSKSQLHKARAGMRTLLLADRRDQIIGETRRSK